MRIIRHRIEVDDEVHELTVPAIDRPILHVVARQETEIDFWVLDDAEFQTKTIRVRTVGTGHRIEPEERWLATCVSPSQVWVWHVLELDDEDAE